MDTIKIIAELYTIFHALNKHYFDNSLPEVFITINQGKSKNKSVYGTFYNKVWNHKIGEDVNLNTGESAPVVDDSLIDEIAISSEYLSRPLANMASTMCHEMVHLYCAINNIEDTSNNGVYHNGRFKAEANKRGLIIEKADTIGWSVTTPDEDFIEFIKSLDINDEVFAYFRNTKIAMSKPTPKKRWVCPCCGEQVQAKKSVKVGCWACNMQMDFWDLTFEGEEEILIDNNNGYAMSDNGWYGYLTNN